MGKKAASEPESLKGSEREEAWAAASYPSPLATPRTRLR